MVEKVFAANWTLARLRALTPKERANIHKNAVRMDTPEARELAAAIETLNLPYSASSGMSMDDPICVTMYEIVFSEEGKAACVKATKEGLPALAGVEPLLVDALGDQYVPEGQGTMTAGSIVGELMMFLGFKNAKQLPMPDGSVAKTAAFWKPK